MNKMSWRQNNWSNSRLASFLLFKPEFATMENWEVWRKENKVAHPFKYWLVEECFDAVQNVLYWPTDMLHTIRYYIYNRFIYKSHMLRTGLDPGQYHSVDERILNGLFTELVDFIEVEKAWHHCACDVKARKKYKPKRGFWRCPEAGLELLDWECNLFMTEDWGVYPESPHYGELTNQAIGAREQKRLYNWWKNERPNRPDSMDVSGWSAYCDTKRDNLFGERTERKESNKILDIMNKIDEQYDAEDEANMIALIKIRRGLWT